MEQLVHPLWGNSLRARYPLSSLSFPFCCCCSLPTARWKLNNQAVPRGIVRPSGREAIRSQRRVARASSRLAEIGSVSFQLGLEAVRPFRTIPREKQNFLRNALCLPISILRSVIHPVRVAIESLCSRFSSPPSRFLGWLEISDFTSLYHSVSSRS